MAPPSSYLAVLRASYDYDPQSEDELAIKEDQLLLLVERTDDDWWKVKPKDVGDESGGGLVPAAYVEPASHKSMVKALYDYEATAPGELTISEDELLLVFDTEEDWLLVQSQKEGGLAGYVPANYVEETNEDAEEEETVPQSAKSAIVVPDSPPRPKSVYVDPAERVAQSHSKAQADSIQTWAVSEVDKKGKKKKGTLGVGNGAIFFASESDKTPVQKWQTSDIDSSRIDKSKHVYIEIGGSNSASLHFNAGSKDTAEAIIAKLESSKLASSISPATSPVTSPVIAPVDSPSPMAESPKPKKNGVSVHFATTPPSIISPREASEYDQGDGDYFHAQNGSATHDDGNEWVTVLYDFTAAGDDELSVGEGDRLIVLEKDGDEWWKVRNTEGHEGVVPASYVELDEQSEIVMSPKGINGIHTEDDTEREIEDQQREEEEREKERERLEAERREERERERARIEAERKAKAALEAAEAERQRKERERKKKEEEEERLQRENQEAEHKRAARQSRPASSSGGRAKAVEEGRTASPSLDSTGKNRVSTDGKTRGGPSPQKTRTWHDRTGQFKVDAEFLGFSNGKLRLHKVNGVVIEVPVEKMSAEDMRYVEKLVGKKYQGEPSRALSPGASDDDVPLAERRKSLQPEPRQPAKPTPPPKKGPSIDWFEFFLNAGCDIDDCTRYAASFERDKIDESILSDITQQSMRLLGLREGDIIRVTKAISQRVANSGGKTALEEQMKRDEEFARKLQEEENGGRSTPARQSTAPNLFSGPGGALKNNVRRGRPQPSKSTPPATVDLQSITTASEQINRRSSPSVTLTASPTVLTPVTSPPRSSSAAAGPITNGFDDDPWIIRTSSTKPLAPTPPIATARPPSTPPAPPAPPVETSSPQVSTPVAAMAVASSLSPVTAQSSTPSNLARTTEADVFDQLARLSVMKSQNSAANSPSPAQASASVSPPVMASPVSFQNGLGMGPSPIPLGQLQTQATGFTPVNPGSRGPFAPVPANQSLLQPLIPTTTGFNSFIPTRPASNPPMFNPPPPQPSFIQSQPTGFPGTLASQPTGFPSTGPLMAQTTSYPGAFGAGPFAGGRTFSPLQPNVTGINSSFNHISTPPPIPPLPPLPANNNATNSTSPANIFAQMKSGTFGNDSAPQTSTKYDALRPQPTGWTPGFQNGYSGTFY